MPLGEQLKEYCSRCFGKRKTDQLPEKQPPYIATTSSTVAPTTPPTPGSSTANASIASKSTTPASTDISDVTQVGNVWLVDGVGTFDHRALYTFQNGFPEGLEKSNYTLNQRGPGPNPAVPFSPHYEPRNVHIYEGMLALTVPGGQRPSEPSDWRLSCAQVETVAHNIQYGSVRTKAMFSQVPGTCHGLFFYQSDTQEVDIEYVTDPSSLSNNGPDNPIPLNYTNQAVNPANAPATHATGPAPSNCTTAVHEYRIDWTPYYTAFYLDGKLQKKFTTNVPREPGAWIWNNWANGNKGFSCGPPKSENTLLIKSIEMYYNTSQVKRSA
ncbi:hypothetical protein LTR93_010346 [Exophiala xenobiotica]|nr:hypothetical protein LTR93_010346 [Exophiala xenobiotica]